MNGLPIGTQFFIKGKGYCVTSCEKVGPGYYVGAVGLSNPFDDWWYTFYFRAEQLSEITKRASLQTGAQGVEGEHHE